MRLWAEEGGGDTPLYTIMPAAAMSDMALLSQAAIPAVTVDKHNAVGFRPSGTACGGAQGFLAGRAL